MEKKIFKHLKKIKKLEQSSKVGLWNISWEQGQFLWQLVKLYQAKTIVEIGTSSAFSTIWMADAASTYNGKVYTIESSPKRIPLAKKHIQESNLDNIYLIEGHAPEVFDDLPPHIDMVFIDATKKQYKEFYTKLAKKFSRTTCIIADNTVSHKDVIQPYLEYVRSLPHTISTSIPIDQGMELTIHDKTII